MTSSSFEVTSVVTQAGITAAIDAGLSGPEIVVTGFRIGSKSAAEGAVALITDTDVEDFVYEDLTTDNMRYSRVDDDTSCWIISLSPQVGPFDIGNIGLMMAGGTMFAKAVLPTQSGKYPTSPPTIVGNRKFYNILLTLTNVSNLLDLTVIESTICSLPEVADETDLPDPTTTPYNAWLVRNHTHIGQPCVGIRLNNTWEFSPYHKYPNQGLGVLASLPALYDASCTTPSVVSFDSTTKTFFPADSNVKLAVGIRTATYQLTTTGMLPGALFSYLPATLTVGTFYFAGTGANVGKLVTPGSGPIVAIAISTLDLWVNTSGNLVTASSTNPDNIDIILPWVVGPGLLPGAPVYPYYPTKTWLGADPTNPLTVPVGCLNEYKNRVISGGKLHLPGGSAWPTPLTVDNLHYCDAGANAGLATTSSANRWILGRAIDIDMVIIDMVPLASPAEAAAGTVTFKGVSPADLPRFTASTSPPVSPRLKDQWWSLNEDVLYEYTTDGTTSFWLEIT